MNLQDSAINQHFLSQVEQRLNAINPNAKLKNQRIYAFDLQDRESYKISLRFNNGVKIHNTLSLDDLFSFDVIEKIDKRYNFELLFHKYDTTIKCSTSMLLEKIKHKHDIKKEIFNIFSSKFLNFIRNPYSIKKVINTFPDLLKYTPTNQEDYKNFNRIINGKKPHQNYLCMQLDISDQDYIDWLTIIFMLLSHFQLDQPNFMEEMVKNLYENPNVFVIVYIYTYNDKSCLLSDRGYSIPIPGEDHMAFDFNLCSNAFIRYVFGEVNKLAPYDTPEKLLESYKTSPKVVRVHNSPNDLDALAQYHRHVVYQCHSTVYNSNLECYGL